MASRTVSERVWRVEKHGSACEILKLSQGARLSMCSMYFKFKLAVTYLTWLNAACPHLTSILEERANPSLCNGSQRFG